MTQPDAGARTGAISTEALMLVGLLLVGRCLSGAVGRHWRFMRRYRPGACRVCYPMTEHDTQVAD